MIWISKRTSYFFCSRISIRHFNFLMNRFHPTFYFDTAILIFCYFVSYLLYHFTSLVIISHNYLFFLYFEKLIRKKLQDYVKRNYLKEKVALGQSRAVMTRLNVERRECRASHAKYCTTLNERKICWV